MEPAGLCGRCTGVAVPLRVVPSPTGLPSKRPSAPALRILYHALNLDWRFISHMIIYMFQCHSPKSSHPCPLPQSPKDCSIHLCLFCYLAYRVIITIFLNSIYTREGRDLGVAFQAPPGSQASSRGEAKDSALLSSHDGHLLEPTLWPKGSQASCGVWKEDSVNDHRVAD